MPDTPLIEFVRDMIARPRRTPSPDGAQAFAAACARLGFPLPWTQENDTDEIVAADGTVVCHVDPDGMAPVEDAPDGMCQLMTLITVAANTAGGMGSKG